MAASMYGINEVACTMTSVFLINKRKASKQGTRLESEVESAQRIELMASEVGILRIFMFATSFSVNFSFCQ